MRSDTSPTADLPSKIVCAGRNYAAHAKELGNDVPAEPLIFLKAPSALIRTGEPIHLPPDSNQVEFEGEIAIRIGTRCRHQPEERAWEVVDAILPLNDVTARDLQRSDDQWSRAKGFDTFAPIGPAVPLDDVDLDTLTVVTRVNGVERQRGEIGQMAFSIPRLIAYVSRIMTLEPGDLIATGSPEGVGPLFDGDEVEVEIVGHSRVVNPVVGPDAGD